MSNFILKVVTVFNTNSGSVLSNLHVTKSDFESGCKWLQVTFENYLF